MKKIFTLIVSAIMVTSAFAQHQDGKDFKNSRHENNSYSFNSRERDKQIMKINREYDYKIAAVKDKLFMNRFKKARIIASLEKQRKDEINTVYAKFNNGHSRYDDKDSKTRW